MLDFACLIELFKKEKAEKKEITSCNHSTEIILELCAIRKI